MAEDIRNTGPVGLRGLKGLNSSQNMDNQDMSNMSLKDQWALMQSTKRSNPYMFSSAADTPVGLAAMAAGYGDSQYDKGITSESQLNDLNEIRYENQPWYDTLFNGIGKMYGKAATTFLSSVIGIPYGIFQGVGEQRFSAIWDNDFTQVLSDVDHWLDDNLVNYKSQKQQNAPWYDPSNLFSMNFLADDIITNYGFTMGAAGSMMIGAGEIGLLAKTLGAVGKMSKAAKMGTNFASALFSATGEGMIEAKQGVEERNKLKFQELDDAFIPERQAIQLEREQADAEYAANKGRYAYIGADGRPVDPAYDEYMTRLQAIAQDEEDINKRHEAAKAEIIDSGQNMGNAILAGNQVLLTAGNMLQFSKGMTRAFDTARHAAEATSKFVKPALVTAEKIGNQYVVKGKGKGMAYAGLKGLITEGSEEMNQQWIQNSAGELYNREDVNDYWRAKLDPEATNQTTDALYTLGSVISKGFKDSWGDIDQWEQFLIGGLTGLAGSPSPTKVFNQDKTKSVLNPARYMSWEGGVVNEIKDFNREYRQYEENINELNEILQSEGFYDNIKSQVGHTYTENGKTVALELNDKKAWKDEDDKQMIHDIQAFVRAGRLGDLRAIYNEMGKELSDEDIESIYKSTTRQVTKEEDKKNYDEVIDEQIAAKQREVNALYDEAEKVQDEMMNPEEDGFYMSPDYAKKHNQELMAEIAAGEQEIEQLNAQKQNYTGQSYYEGAFVDSDGNHLYTNDEIRAQIKHNSDELNRKLDSYLESINEVNERTQGKLSNEQEDNLTYLHNLGKESNVRMQKIMAGVRKQLPNKFLLKTTKTPEQLSKEYVSSDLTFNKDENTKEGYVEVDTSLINDKAFADFFQKEVLRSGNVRPEFAETADERAAREEEEKNLPEEEKKKRVKERASKKWKDALKQAEKDAKEQFATNWEMLVNNFFENYKRDNNASESETINAFLQVKQDLLDAAALYNQTGEYQRALDEYMSNPQLIEEDKAKAETKAQKAEEEKKQKNTFEGKDAKQIKQDLANGTIDPEEFSNFANMDLSGDAPKPRKDAQQEAKKAQESNQKASALKQHIQEQLGNNPTQEELNAAQIAMQMVDAANLATENPEDLNIDTPELNQVPLDSVDPNASMEDIETLNTGVQQMLADAFNAFEEDKNAQDDIPETAPADTLNDVEAPETGDDPVVKTKPDVVAPDVQSPSEAIESPIPKNPLTEGAIKEIIDATKKLYEQPNGEDTKNGVWRSCTTRHRYGKSTNTYHDEVLEDKNSIRYKRSKAIWEYLNSVGAFDRLDDSSNDRIREKDVIHFMVKNMSQEIYGKDYNDLTEDEKPYALVILMLNEKSKEVLGDLPLAQFEKNYGNQSDKSQLAYLISLQNKVFKAFDENYKKTGNSEAVVDSMTKDGADNLNLTFDNSKKSLVSKVKQVMRGVVPYRYGEINTLNDVADGQPFELGVAVTDTIVAKKRGDKTQHNDIVKPHVGTVGQPYLLLPTPSGEQMAVPFYMKPFNAEQHRNTEFYKILSNAVNSLLVNSNYSTDAQRKQFKKALDVVEGLLQIKAQEDVRTVVVNKDNVSLYFQSLTNKDQNITLTTGVVPNTVPGNTFEMTKMLVEQLSGIPINVSLQFLNDTIEAGGRKANYNNVIGEIADVNLPKATHHTVNGWFTVELAPSAGIKPSKNLTTKPQQQAIQEVGDNVTPHSNTANSGTQPQATAQPQALPKTVEEINNEMKQKKVIGRQTKDAWDAIPDDLKLKMVNKDQPLQLSFNGKMVVVSISDREGLIQGLTQANMAAKAGNLKVSEAPKHRKVDTKEQKKANIQKEKRWLQQNLPMFSTEDRLKLVQGLIEIPGNEGWAWGRYQSGIITLSDMAAAGTTYHEAFHAVTQTLLTDAELDALYEAAVERYKETSPALLEELLAEDFRKYVQREETPIIGYIRKVFRRILNAMRGFNDYRGSIEQLFYKINNGEFKDTLPRESRGDNAFYSRTPKGVYISESDPAYEVIKKEFDAMHLESNKPQNLGRKWTAFKQRWVAKGYTPIAKYSYDVYGEGRNGYRFLGVQINDEAAKSAAANRKPEVREQYAAQQAREGGLERLAWTRLTPEQQMNLMNEGMTEDAYNKISLEEKDQWVKCRS